MLAQPSTTQDITTLTTLLPRVSVVVPALNEAENLPHVLPRIPVGHEVILVDGGSTDGTIEAALACRPNVRIVTQERRGKGDALASGFAAATGDIIVTLDADGSQRPEEIERFVNALCDGADFVKGSRVTEGGGSTDFTWLRAAGQPLPRRGREPPLRLPLHRHHLRLQRLLERLHGAHQRRRRRLRGRAPDADPRGPGAT